MSKNDSENSRTHDVLIVGGGLVGASLAIALDALGLDVGMLEAAPAGALPPVFDQRNLSFAEATLHALDALGVLGLMRAPTGSIRRIHISRAGDFGRVQLDAREHGRSEFGRVVVARDFGEALEARLDQLAHLTRYRPARFLGVAAMEDGFRCIQMADANGEQLLRARLLVAADGARSAVRTAVGIGSQTYDYAQTLFVARLRSQRAPDGCAFERLTESGPTALLPRGDGHYGLVHGVASAEADAVAALGDAAFLARVQHVFGWRAGRFLDVGPRSAYPMQRYATRRSEDRNRTLTFSDGLAKLTANDAPLLRPLRSAGLLALDASGALQGWLAGGAMGYRGDVPALCRRRYA